ncbi:MAG: ABC transporter permease subunit [Gammaproteobacteria bacterium]|nr:ABC transporter permease subunit [Gammaproteobacteria bacterium]
MIRSVVTSALFDTRLARICSLILGAIVLLAWLGPLFSGWKFDEIDWDALESPPSATHWFGTDFIGRDLFVRSMLGARVSLGIALVATVVSVLVGIPWGAVAGYLGGRTDQLMMRFVDMLYAVPFVLIVILLVVIFGRNPYLLFMALGAIFWLDIARIVRGQTLRLRTQPFIAAARLLGVSTPAIVLRHVVPNVMGPALVYATLTIPGVILAESFISFLGLGIQEPDTSWGVLIADGTQTMESSPWTLIFPGVLLAMTIWCTNMLGDRLRDRMEAATGYTRASGRRVQEGRVPGGRALGGRRT